MLIKSVNAPQKPAEWDGDWRLIEYDPFTGISDWWLMHDDGSFTIRKIQHNTDAILEANKAEKNENAGKRWGEGRKVATVPLTVFEALGMDEALANKDMDFIKKRLNDSDYSALRTFEGNL